MILSGGVATELVGLFNAIKTLISNDYKSLFVESVINFIASKTLFMQLGNSPQLL
jgi:hypothetical protein